MLESFIDYPNLCHLLIACPCACLELNRGGQAILPITLGKFCIQRVAGIVLTIDQ